MTEVVSFLKGKSAVAVAQQCGGRQGHGNRATFRAREGMRSPRWDVKQSTCAVISAPRSSALSKAGMKTVTAKSRCARASGSPWGCSPPSSPPLCGGVMTPTGKPPPLAVGLAKALPFQRAQVEMRDALAAHDDLHMADGAYAQVALFPGHTARHGDVMTHTQRQQGVGRAFRPFLHVTGPLWGPSSNYPLCG